MDIAELIARESVRYTVSLYNSAADRRDYALLHEVFTEDARFIIGNEKLEGRDKIIESSASRGLKRRAHEPGAFQRHLLGNSIINIMDENTARSVHYIMVMTELGLDHSGVYVDRFMRSGDRWLISERQANPEWKRPDSRLQLAPRPFTTEELDLGFKRSEGA